MTVNILYLYPDFMSLYGDNGNVRILEKRLKDQGFEVQINKATITDEKISFEDADLVYMGSGYESNRNLAAKHLAKFKTELFEAVDEGVPMLFTGNSYDILGKGITSADGSFGKAWDSLVLRSGSSSKSVTRAMSSLRTMSPVTAMSDS